MKTIIVATDYSDSAEVALKYATFIARLTKTKIALLNIYTFNIHALNGRISPAAMDNLIESNQQHLEHYAKKLSLKYDIALSAHTLTSIEDYSLEKFAQSLNAGLIVMGMNRNLSDQSLSGNISSSIIKNTKLPVLVVPQGVEFKLPERLLYACDYHAVPNEDHLQELNEIAGTFGAEVQVFHITKNPFQADEALQAIIIEQLENSLQPVSHSYRDKNARDIIEGLKEGIDEFKADILVMSPHKYGFWSSLFHKSKTREMALKSTIPLLSLPS